MLHLVFFGYFKCSIFFRIGNRFVDVFVLNVELLPKILFAVRSDVENPVSDGAGDVSSSLSEPDAMT